MNGPAFTIRPQGDRCLSLDFGQDIRAETGLVCLSAAATLRAASLAGVSDIVPSYTAVALFYSPGTQEQPVTFASLSREVKRVLSGTLLPANASSRLIKIPVCYGGVHGPDLSDVAKRTGLTEDEVVAKHSASDTMVFSLGFSPGHPYIGIHDEIFAIPRRDVPRTVVPRGKNTPTLRPPLSVVSNRLFCRTSQSKVTLWARLSKGLARPWPWRTSLEKWIMVI